MHLAALGSYLRRLRTPFVIGLVIWIISAGIFWLWGAPLGHDEAQYALAGRHALAGEAPHWHYLSYGMNLLAIPGVLAGGSEVALRLIPLLGGIGFVLAAAHLARRLMGTGTAGWFVVLLAGTHCLTRRGAELLSDLPACMCLLLATVVVVEELGSDAPPRWRLLQVAPWLAAAFYLRYGSCLSIAAIGAVALVVGWSAVLRRPAPVLATAAALVVLLLPHAWMATQATGSPQGFLVLSSRVIDHTLTGGLITYVTTNPLLYYGLATTPVLIIGLGAIARIGDRRRAMVWALAIANLLVVGLTTRAQSRYVFYTLTLLSLVGLDEALRWWRTRPPASQLAWRRIAVGILAVSCLETLVVVTAIAATTRGRLERTLEAAATIRRAAAGAPCVVRGRHTTQLEWYSGCVAVMKVDPDVLGHQQAFVVRDPREADQPALEQQPGVVVPILERPGELTVVRLDPPPRRAPR